jgi:hypothetical protein
VQPGGEPVGCVEEVVVMTWSYREDALEDPA